MQYHCRISGIAPIIHNSGASIAANDWSRERATLTAKKGTNRTASDEERIAFLDCLNSLWLDSNDAPTIPPHALRANIENGAKKLKQGPAVREGLLVVDSQFEYDRERYGTTLDELGNRAQFTIAVVRNRARVEATRAMFDLPWACEFELDCDEELVDAEKLANWLDIAGRRIGLGDWRPQRSGHYGRFTVESITETD